MGDDRALRQYGSLEIRDDIENDGNRARYRHAVSVVLTESVGLEGESSFQNIEEMDENSTYVRVRRDCGLRRQKVGAIQ